MREAEKMAICTKAVATFGAEHQYWKAIEELGELSTAIAKRIEAKPVTPEMVTTRFDLIDEMADVSIMLMQLKILECADSLEDRISYKLGRLAGRMEAEGALLLKEGCKNDA